MDSPIKHDETQKKFSVVINGLTAFISYETPRPGVMDLQHTFVPEDLRGMSLAGRLTEFALEHARQHGDKIMPTCSYIKKYLEKHPQYAELDVSAGKQ
jgi:uncharacterized protein